MTVAMAFCMLFAFGTFSASADELAETPAYSFTMNGKAQAKIIYEDDVFENGIEVKNAIRFTSQITKGAIDDIANDHNVKVKTIIIKKDVLGDVAFTKASLDEAELKYQQVIFSEGKNLTTNESEDGKNYVFQACLYNVQDANYTADLCAVSYLEVDGIASEYTNVVTANLWDVANDYKATLDANSDGIVDDESKYGEEFAYLSKISATYEVKVTGFDGEVATYNLKHGEYLDADKIAEDLNVEGTAYFNGTIDGLDITKCVTGSVEATAGMDAMTFVANETGYTLTSAVEIAPYTTDYIVPDTYNNKPVNDMSTAEDGQGNVFNAFKLAGLGQGAIGNATSVTLPVTITKLYNRDFMQCLNLKYIDAKGVSNFGAGWNFAYCESLEYVILSDGLTTIPDGTFFDDAGGIEQGRPEVKDSVSIYLYNVDGATNKISSISSNNNQMLIEENVYKYNEIDCINTWKYNNEGKIVLSEATAHTYVEGICSCGDSIVNNVTYEWDSTLGGYVASGLVNKNVSEIYIKGTHNGSNGEDKVLGVKTGAFTGALVGDDPNNPYSYNKQIKKVVMHENVTTIYGTAFMNCRGLVEVVAPGVTTINSLNFAYDESLKVVILGNVSGIPYRFFFNDTSVSGQTDVFLMSKSESFTNGGDNALYSGSYYVYSKTPICGVASWYYNDNGEIVKVAADSHKYVEGVCSCGDSLVANTLYEWVAKEGETAGGYWVASGLSNYNVEEVYVKGTHTGTVDGVEKTAIVKAIKEKAFGATGGNKTIKKIVCHENVTLIYGYAFMHLYNLETLIAPGLLAFAPHSNGNNFHFAYCYSIKTVVAGNLTGIANRTFYEDDSDGIYNGAICSIYLTVATNNIANIEGDNQSLITENIYTYSEDYAEGCWHYDDATGMPTLWTAEQA